MRMLTMSQEVIAVTHLWWEDSWVGAHWFAGHAGVECAADVLRVDCQVGRLAQVRQRQRGVLRETRQKA